MLKQFLSEKKFKAITYISPKNSTLCEFGFAFEKGKDCPVVKKTNISMPQDKKALENFVAIKVEGCGICGTDIHMYYGKRFLDEKPIRENLIIPGHEIFGKVEAAETKFRHLIGKDVVIDPIIDCYGKKKCSFCAINKNYMHLPFREMGICGSVPGGFGEYAIGLGKNCFPVANLSIKQKALIEPLATLIYAFKYVLNVPAEANKYLLIGSGTAGLLALQYLKKINKKNFIILADKNTLRLNTARKLGADKVFRTKSGKGNNISEFHKLLGKDKLDFILELSGSDEAINLIPAFASRLTKVLLYGLGHKKVTVNNFDLIVEKELTFYSSLGASNSKSFKEASEIIKGFSADKVVTHVYKGLSGAKKAVKKDCFKNNYIKGVLVI